MAAVDLDDAQADILHSMSSDDRQTKAEYQRGCAALAALVSELRTLRASAAEGASRTPVEAGVVTRAHRAIAAGLVRESDGNPSLAAWVADGDVNEGNWWICDACVMDAAQAIADAEARGAARTPPAELYGEDRDIEGLHAAADYRCELDELRAEVERRGQNERELAEGWAKLRESKRAIRAEAWERGSREGLDAVNPYGDSAPPADEVAGLDFTLLRVLLDRANGTTEYWNARDTLDRLEAHIKGKPASPPQEPPARAVVEGSVWRHKGSGALRTVTDIGPRLVWLRSDSGGASHWHIDEFRRGNEWISDPQEGERES